MGNFKTSLLSQRPAATTTQAADSHDVDPSRSVTHPEFPAIGGGGATEDIFTPSPRTPTPTALPPPFANRTLSHRVIGQESAATRLLQQSLVKLGYLDRKKMPRNESEWGAYMKPTRDAVAAFQGDAGYFPKPPAVIGDADIRTQQLIRAQVPSADGPTIRRWRG